MWKLIHFFLLYSALNNFVYADKLVLDRESLRPMTVYASPTCGCCGAWIEHIEAADINVHINYSNELDAIKETLGISPQYQACHTGVKDGYFFEGHIPAEIIQRFLGEAPKDIIGLSVPGMPLGSPGMDVEGNYQAYEVLSIHKNGSNMPYARVSPKGIDYL